jgi:Ca-activated chloride channel family protein
MNGRPFNGVMTAGCVLPAARIVFVIGCLLVAIAGPSVRAQPQAPAFRAGVDLVSFTVTATDAGQRHISDLNREDFVVVEDGAMQQITFFAKSGIPLALALLIDSSASMEPSLSRAQEAAIGFVRQMAPADLATVIDFDSIVKTAQEPTGDRVRLERAIREVAAGGSTALYNAVYIGLRGLEKLTSIQQAETSRRGAMVLLSDGEDTSSIIALDDVLDLAKRSDSVIYAIGLDSRDLSGPRRSADGRRVLRDLAMQSGGRAFFTQSSAELAAIYNDIRQELSSQYVIGYESRNQKRDGRWRTVSIRVARPGVQVRTRPGYFAPAR